MSTRYITRPVRRTPPDIDAENPPGEPEYHAPYFHEDCQQCDKALLEELNESGLEQDSDLLNRLNEVYFSQEGVDAFNVYRHFNPLYPFTQSSYEHIFVPVALPGKRLITNFRIGDIILLRTILSGKTLQAIVINPELVTNEMLTDYPSNSSKTGSYVQVYGNISGNGNERGYIRLTDNNNRLLNNIVVLRKLSTNEEKTESNSENITDSTDVDETGISGEELVEDIELPQPLSFSKDCRAKLDRISVAVVGGGLAGLIAARQLGQHGIKVTLYEAHNQWGGRVRSNTTFSKGRIIEEGAELIGSFHTTWLALAQQYGISCISRMGDESYGLECLNIKLKLDKLLSMDEQKELYKQMKKRVLEPIAALASQINNPSQPWLIPGLQNEDNLSVADALVKHYGINPNERLWKMVEFLLVNNEVAPLEEMNFLGLLCKVRAGQGPRCNEHEPSLMGYWEELEIFRCANGCQKLATGMVDEMKKEKWPVKLQLSRAITNMDISKSRVVIGSKQVIWGNGKLDDNPAIHLPYDYVILAIPPSVWPGVSVTFEGKKVDLYQEIGQLGMNPCVKFFSDVKERFWIQEKAAPSGGTLTLGQIWEGTDNQTQVGDQGIVLSVFAGPIVPTTLVPGGKGYRSPTADECKKELSNLYRGYSGNLKKTLFSDWPNTPFIKTGYSSPKKGQIFTIGKKLNEPFRDRLFFAGEHTQMDSFGYMEGALRSGERVADLLVKQTCGLIKPEPVHAA